MRIILSPAKTMEPDTEGQVQGSAPFPDETRQLVRKIQRLTKNEQRKIWHTSDKLTTLNRDRYREMDPLDRVTPALTTFRGLVFKQIAPEVMSQSELTYLDQHLRILSGLYGVLKPSDGVVPYRLEMGAPLAVGRAKDLYAFWGDTLARSIMKDADTLLNLASDEYAKAVLPHIPRGKRVIQIDFGELVDGAVKRKATHAKMARGQMVRMMAEQQIEDPEAVKAFTGQGFRYSEAHSEPDHWIYIQEP